MTSLQINSNLKNPIYWFCFGWCLILLVPTLTVMPYMNTFIHPWRAEATASLVFLITFIFLLYQQRNKPDHLDLSRLEINFIIIPLLAFIAWSGLSIFWSASWRSAFYHTLIWSEYLFFYVIARQILNQKKGFQAFLISLTITLLIIGLPPAIEYFQFLTFGEAVTTLGGRYAKYGELVNTVCPLITVAVLRLNGRRFVLGLLVVVSMWLFIISTLGRTNLLLFAASLAFITGLIFVFKRFHKYRKKMALIVLAVVLVPIPFHLVSYFAEKPNVPLVTRMSDETGVSYSSDVRKLLKSVTLEMIKTHPIMGVGADNYGMEFNNYRAVYAAKNPTDVNLMTAEVESAERSHNEYLQILSELGIIGGFIFAWFLSSLLLMTFTALKRIKRVSLLPIASLLGIAFFLASSVVSSFSFRLVQNGFVFFFALAVAAKFLLASKSEKKSTSKIQVSAKQLKLGYSMGMVACLLLATHCLVRVASVYYSRQAQFITNVEEALPYYETSFWLDTENPTAHYALGMNLLLAQKYSDATEQLKQAIKAQRATSPDFSYLATAQTLAGDTTGAEKTIAEALRLYPLSLFVRTRYAILLKANGKLAESEEQLQIAMEMNKREAITWWTLMNEGARQASMNAAQNNYYPVNRLTPEVAIYAIVTEREIRFPDEKFVIPKTAD